MKPLYMVFDVESVGLHGESFSVGFSVVNQDGVELDYGLYACDSRLAKEGVPNDAQWVEANVPPVALTHTTLVGFRNAFWTKWMQWKKEGALLFADCAWPVEARFLIECIETNREGRNWEGPYPLHDIASVLLAKGKDPMEKRSRLATEMPEHNPLADARQSARLLIEALYY